LLAGILLAVFVGLPAAVAGLSFVGRIAPDSVIPDAFDVFVSVPDPARLAGRVLRHEALPDIMALAEMAPLMSALNQAGSAGLAENWLVRLAARGQLKAAALPDGRILAAWDAGLLSPLLRFLPALAGRIDAPGLYHVQSGRGSRFEFRLDGGDVFFIAPHRNLLVLSSDLALFESALDGTSRDGDAIGADAKAISSRDHDIAFLVSPGALESALAGEGADPQIASALGMLRFPGNVEAALSIMPGRLRLRLTTPLSAENAALRSIIERNSRATPILSAIPGDAQYMTLLAAGGLRELMDAAGAISGPDFEATVRRADSAARLALRMPLDDLLFSWTGEQFAVFGLEGRPNPVLAIEIGNEARRREVFDRAFDSIFLTEDVRLNLDGTRIPRIQLPGFLNPVMSLLGVSIPAPFYSVQGNYLLLSESAEALLSAVNSIRRNEVLPRQALWRELSAGNTGPSSITLFYSLERSIPFFLRGNSAALAVLRLYHQGLARVYLEGSALSATLTVVPGARTGVVPVVGYPLDLSAEPGRPGAGRLGNRLFAVSSGRNARLIVTRDNDVLAVSPADRSVREMRGFGSAGAALHAVPQAPAGRGADGDAWVADSMGHVSLVTRELESLRGFPLSTGIRLSAPPAAWGGRLFLAGEGGEVYVVDSRASVSLWGSFGAALRAPPSFLEIGGRSFVGIYPKDIIFGEIYVLSADGAPLPGWPVHVPGIAFGSPALFAVGQRPARLHAAFITQAGELAVYTESAEMLPGFPVQLDGVFFLQPVFDGEILWVIESAGTLFRVSLYGEVASAHVPRLSVREEGHIMAAGGEIFFTGEGNALHGHSRDLSPLAGFPLPVWGAPVIGDIDGDGTREVAGVGMDNRLHMWQFR